MHGLVGWFECELAEGVWMTNSPLSDVAIDRPQVFLPIEDAIQVKAGDRVTVTVMTRPADSVLAWSVEFSATGQRFQHSTWNGLTVSPAELIRACPDRVPSLNREASARIIVLRYCDGRRTVSEIEQAVSRDHPNLFPSPEESSRFVAQVLGRDTE
jgi:protein arginine N-methyltransferase 1